MKKLVHFIHKKLYNYHKKKMYKHLGKIVGARRYANIAYNDYKLRCEIGKAFTSGETNIDTSSLYPSVMMTARFPRTTD